MDLLKREGQVVGGEGPAHRKRLRIHDEAARLAWGRSRLAAASAGLISRLEPGVSRVISGSKVRILAHPPLTNLGAIGEIGNVARATAARPSPAGADGPSFLAVV